MRTAAAILAALALVTAQACTNNCFVYYPDGAPPGGLCVDEAKESAACRQICPNAAAVAEGWSGGVLGDGAYQWCECLCAQPGDHGIFQRLPAADWRSVDAAFKAECARWHVAPAGR